MRTNPEASWKSECREKSFTLSNGLSVVISERPDRTSMALSTQYGVGYRSEPPGAFGFAHLFEHLMFEGSGGSIRSRLLAGVRSRGGDPNAVTTSDMTDFHQQVPLESLDDSIMLEADRMAHPGVSDQDIEREREIVRQEVDTFRNRPLGTFPNPSLRRALYTKLQNTHDGYGDQSDIDEATLGDFTRFHEHHYSAANAVIAISGPAEVGRVEDAVRRHFDHIPLRHRHDTPGLGEPWPHDVRTLYYDDPWSQRPAMAVGHRAPNPESETEEYIAYELIAVLLTMDGHENLTRRITRDEKSAAHISAGCSSGSGPFLVKDPDTFAFILTGLTDAPEWFFLDAIDDAIEALERGRFTDDVLDAAIAVWTTRVYRSLDGLLPATRSLATGALLFGRPRLHIDGPRIARTLTRDHIRVAAGRMCAGGRAVVYVSPRSRQAPNVGEGAR